jgi:hypothetical protein
LIYGQFEWHPYEEIFLHGNIFEKDLESAQERLLMLTDYGTKIKG